MVVFSSIYNANKLTKRTKCKRSGEEHSLWETTIEKEYGHSHQETCWNRCEQGTEPGQSFQTRQYGPEKKDPADITSRLRQVMSETRFVTDKSREAGPRKASEVTWEGAAGPSH